MLWGVYLCRRRVLTKHIGFPSRTEISSTLLGINVTGLIVFWTVPRADFRLVRKLAVLLGANVTGRIVYGTAPRAINTCKQATHKMQCDLVMIENSRINMANYLTLRMLITFEVLKNMLSPPPAPTMQFSRTLVLRVPVLLIQLLMQCNYWVVRG